MIIRFTLNGGKKRDQVSMDYDLHSIALTMSYTQSCCRYLIGNKNQPDFALMSHYKEQRESTYFFI